MPDRENDRSVQDADLHTGARRGGGMPTYADNEGERLARRSQWREVHDEANAPDRPGHAEPVPADLNDERGQGR